MKQVIISDELYDWLTAKFADEIKLPDDSNVEVLNQKTRMEKFWCWAVWGHIYRNGVCLRCGKRKEGVRMDVTDELFVPK